MTMPREVKWMAGALATVLWITPAAAAEDQPSGGTAGGQSADKASGQAAQDATAQDPAGGMQKDNIRGTGAADMTKDQAAQDSTAQDSAGGQKGVQGTADRGADKAGGTGTSVKQTRRYAKGAASDVAETTSEKAKVTGKLGAARILAKLHAGNETEVKAGTWMKEHATSDRVKEFASKMVDDHGKMDEDVTAFAKDQGIDLASVMRPSNAKKIAHQAKLDRLEKLQGAQADSEYMRWMVSDHQKDVKEVHAATTKAQQSGDDKLATLLGDTGKTMDAHLKEAQDVQKSLQQRQARTPASNMGTGSAGSPSDASAPRDTDSTTK